MYYVYALIAIRNEFNIKEYEFISPIGIGHNVTNFAKFCRDNNLTKSTMEKSVAS